MYRKRFQALKLDCSSGLQCSTIFPRQDLHVSASFRQHGPVQWLSMCSGDCPEFMTLFKPLVKMLLQDNI